MSDNRWFQASGSAGPPVLPKGGGMSCKYVQSEGICQRYLALINANDVASAMQEVNQFALNEGISSPDAYALVLRCCQDSNTGNFPCDRVLPGWCNKFHAAFSSGQNSLIMQGVVNPFILFAGTLNYTLSYSEAYAVLLRCCGDGQTTDIPCDEIFTNLQLQAGWCQKWAQAQQSGNASQIQSEITNLATAYGITAAQAQSVFTRCCPGTGDRPCPPADPNSPFYTTDRFCETDWCVDGQGNPLPSAHPDCVCCDDNTDIDVSPWCPQYVIAVDNADLSAMQTIITTVSTTFGISWTQASQLLYDVCICPDNGNSGPCPPTDPTSPFYTNPGEFCSHCSPGQAYSGHPDCRCCPTTNGPCDNFVDNGCCGKCDNSITPGHQCYSWCQQWGSCCPGTNSNTATFTWMELKMCNPQLQGGLAAFMTIDGRTITQQDIGKTIMYPVGGGQPMEKATIEGYFANPSNITAIGQDYNETSPCVMSALFRTTPPTQGTINTRQAGGNDNPIGMGSMTDGKLSFTGGYANTYQQEEGDFLTDPKGYEQTLEEFFDEII